MTHRRPVSAWPTARVWLFVASMIGAMVLARACLAVEPSERVDLNRASEDELDGVPFVGETFAAALVEERAMRGRFRDLADVAARVPGVTPEILAQWRPWLLLDERGDDVRVFGEAAAVRESGEAWQTMRRRLHVAASSAAGSRFDIEVRETSTATSGAATARAGGVVISGRIGSRPTRPSRPPDAATAAALLSALVPRRDLRTLSLDATSRGVRWTIAGSQGNDSTRAIVDSALADVDPTVVAENDGHSASISWLCGAATRVARRVAVAARVTMNEHGRAQAAGAVVADYRQAAVDVRAGAWWLDVPSAFVVATSSVPDAGVWWLGEGEVALATGQAAPGARLARIAVTVRSAGDRRWSGRCTFAGETHAPPASGLRDVMRATVSAECVAAGESAREPRFHLRATVRTAQRSAAVLDAAVPGMWEASRLNLAAIARPSFGGEPVALAAATSGGAWCVGWSVDRGARRASVCGSLHVVAHGVARGGLAPAWPLLAASVRPRGDGLDVIAEIRRADGDGSLLVGRAVTPRGRPRWWCRLRVGWPS